VSPVYRKKGLSLFLPFLSRSLCLRNYGTDFHTALVLASMAGSRIPTADYGYPHVEWCLRGWFPPTRRHEEDVHICYMTQAENGRSFPPPAGSSELSRRGVCRTAQAGGQRLTGADRDRYQIEKSENLRALMQIINASTARPSVAIGRISRL